MKMICDNGKDVIVSHLKQCPECREALTNALQGFPLLKMILTPDALKQLDAFLKESTP